MATNNTSSTKFILTRDINGYNGFGLPFAFDNYQTTLAANVAQTITVPSNFGTWIAIFSFSPGTNVWVANNDTAEIPGASFASSLSQLNPVAREVHAGDVLSFITAESTNPYVNVALYVATPYTA